MGAKDSKNPAPKRDTKDSKHPAPKRDTKDSKHPATEMVCATEMGRETEKPLVELTTRTNGEFLESEESKESKESEESEESEESKEIKHAFQDLKNHFQFGVIDLLLGLSGPLPTKKAEIERLNNVLHIDSRKFAHIITISSAFIQTHKLRRNPNMWVDILGPLVG
jgi:hypothetical protein